MAKYGNERICPVPSREYNLYQKCQYWHSVVTTEVGVVKSEVSVVTSEVSVVTSEVSVVTFEYGISTGVFVKILKFV